MLSFSTSEIFNISYSVFELPGALVSRHFLKLKPRTFREMSSKPKAPEIAAEAKKIYIPYIKQKYPQWDTTSYLIADSALQMRCSPSSPPLRCRIGM